MSYEGDSLSSNSTLRMQDWLVGGLGMHGWQEQTSKYDFPSDGLAPVVFETVDPSFFLEKFSSFSVLLILLYSGFPTALAAAS